MKKKIFIAAAVIISSTAYAQQVPNKFIDTTKLLNEVVITANKYPNKSILTGKVLSVITKEMIQKSGANDVAQILTNQAGIYINGFSSNAGKDKNIYLRGAKPEYILITIDGIPMYDASGIGGNFDIKNIALDNVERIEILKGSQSTLYGSDALAGVINVITKHGSDKKMSFNGLLSAGSNNTIKASAGMNGTKNKFDYNINYSATTTKGINETTSNFANADKDGYQQSSLFTSFGIPVTKKIKLLPYFSFTNNKGDLDQGAFVDESDFTYQQKSIQAGFKSTIDIKNTRINILYNHNTIDRTYTDDSIKSRNGFYTYSKGSYSAATNFIDAYTTLTVSKIVKLTVGADFSSSTSNQNFNALSTYGLDASKYSSDSLYQNQFSIYAAANFNTQNGFNLELGNRLNIHSTYGSNDVFNINPSFLINKKVKLFANLSSGYRTPSLYQLFSEYGNKKLLPETALNIEGGLQYFANDIFTARVVLFKRDIKNVIFFNYNPATFVSQYINQDKQKDKGLELDATYTGIKNTSIKLFYNYVDGNITTKNAAKKDTTFFNLLRRPKNYLGINIGTTITQPLFISATITAFGKREDQYFDATTFNTVSTTLKSYQLLNVYADYSFLKNKIKLFVDLQNITNTQYEEVSGYNTLGFNVFVGARFNF
jgi:vitamin B12 transporter